MIYARAQNLPKLYRGRNICHGPGPHRTTVIENDVYAFKLTRQREALIVESQVTLAADRFNHVLLPGLARLWRRSQIQNLKMFDHFVMSLERKARGRLMDGSIIPHQ